MVERLLRSGKHNAVIVEAPPGAGKSTLTASVANQLIASDKKLRLAIVTQTNELADDLVEAIVTRYPKLGTARLVGQDGSSETMAQLASSRPLAIGQRADDEEVRAQRIVVATARKWQYERSRIQSKGGALAFPFALIDEAYQMRSDMLLGIADLYETLFCVGDPGQLDPFTTVDDSLWKGLPYSPSRTALGTLRAFHPELQPYQMPVSWRLPPSAAPVVARAFYPVSGFEAGTAPDDRELVLGRPRRKNGDGIDHAAVASAAAETGWAYVELPERFTPRTDGEIATTIAGFVVSLLDRGGTVVDKQRAPSGKPLAANRVAIIAAHNDQVHAIRYALSRAGRNPDDVVVATANKIQGREYDVSVVWHPLAGRRDATSFHLEAGRMCVMLSRHRHACVVVGRAGASRLLEEFPDSDPMFLDEPEKFPDGWEANYEVLRHLAMCRVGK
jgi:hypothetical protein